MIRVYLSAQNQTYIVEVMDHSEPQVCAAVSVLIGTLKGWLANRNKKPLEDKTVDGYACIIWKGGEKSRTIFQFLQIGFLQLELSYPNEIQVLGKRD